MTPSDAARLSALEARERARDAALWKLAVAQIKSHHSLSDHRQPWEHLRNTVAPPSPPAAEGEAVPMPEPRIEDRWITEARQVYAAIAVFGWEITWKHYKAVPDDAWPIDIIAKALRAAATRATPGPSGKELAYDDMDLAARDAATWAQACRAMRGKIVRELAARDLLDASFTASLIPFSEP